MNPERQRNFPDQEHKRKQRKRSSRRGRDLKCEIYSHSVVAGG